VKQEIDPGDWGAGEEMSGFALLYLTYRLRRLYRCLSENDRGTQAAFLPVLEPVVRPGLPATPQNDNRFPGLTISQGVWDAP